MKVIVGPGIHPSFPGQKCSDCNACFARATLLKDFDSSFGPDVGLGSAVVVVEIVHDGLPQFVNAFEDAAVDALSGSLGKEPLDQVEPTAGLARGLYFGSQALAQGQESCSSGSAARGGGALGR